jgi:N-acetylglutamate synthase
VPKPRAFFLARSAGVGTATALGVIVDGVAVVECVATAPTARRQGHALRVMQALETWAFDADARTIALQVVARNTAARALYEGLGYGETSNYHYRVRGA